MNFMPHWASMLVNEIPDDQFATRLGTTINHPAFVLGHLSYYAAVAVQLLGGEVEIGENEAVLYQHGAECCDDASAYPDKQACIELFNARMKMAANFIATSSEETLNASAADTPFAERFDTLGQVATFMLIAHPPFHFGQLSAWRRVAGIGPAS